MGQITVETSDLEACGNAVRDEHKAARNLNVLLLQVCVNLPPL